MECICSERAIKLKETEVNFIYSSLFNYIIMNSIDKKPNYKEIYKFVYVIKDHPALFDSSNYR